jgi:hypothetical protein
VLTYIRAAQIHYIWGQVSGKNAQSGAVTYPNLQWSNDFTARGACTKGVQGK